MKAKTLLVLVGPTAIGKTALAIRLAEQYKTEIISADSRQFFKEMAIGTAKPTTEELSQATHHFVDFLSITEEYNAGIFEREALQKIEELFLVKDVVILAGGSGMYVKAVCEGLDDLPSSKEVRAQLNDRLAKDGVIPLQEELKELDPTHYKAMDIHNPQRLIRALEVCLVSEKPYSSFRKNQKVDRPFNIVKIGITADREVIYERINQRVDIMVSQGLIAEVNSLLPYRTNNALITVGYRELFEYFDKKLTKDEAIELIKRNTRRFAKRQLTWFRKDMEINWFYFLDQPRIDVFLEGNVNFLND